MKKIIGKKLDIDSLMEIYMLANTPFYLYKHFKRNPSIIDVSREFTSEELISTFYNIVDNGISDIKALIFIYGLVIASTNKPYAEVHHFFKELKRFNLKLFDEISDIYLSTANNTQFIDKK